MTDMTIPERIVEKVTSGQWLLTMAAAFAFVYMVVTRAIETDNAMTIIGVVVYAYFNRDRSKDQADGRERQS